MGTMNGEGPKAVETDLEELEEKIKEHRKKIFHRVLIVIAVVLVLFISMELFMALRVYDSYEVQNKAERTDSEATKFVPFAGNVVKYSNDGILYMDTANELIWNQAFEMNDPQLQLCENYLVVYDRGGTQIYIMSDTGLQKQINTTVPIRTACIARQGTIAVLMKEQEVSHVKLFDKTGKELANGEFYASKGGFPIDIALSYDAQKLAVDMLDVNDGEVKSTISFYNFGSVGQNEINNNVGTFAYSDMLIPEIAYVSDTRMLALADNEILIFEGNQKPEVSEKIYIQQSIQSVFYNEKYIGMILDNGTEEDPYLIQVYDMRGNCVMEAETAFAYEHAEFLANNEVCLTNQYECEIYTIHSIRKFSYNFDAEIYKIMSRGTSMDYTFILEGETDEVRLR